MRTEAEVRDAIRHMTEAKETAQENRELAGVAMLNIMIDMLRWTLGEPSEFAETKRNCDGIDRRRQQGANRGAN